MFKILLTILLISVGLFFSFSWAIIYHLVKFGAKQRTTKTITIFFIGGSLVIIGVMVWTLLNLE